MPKKYNISFYGMWPEIEDCVKQYAHGLAYSTYSNKLTLQNLDLKTEILASFVESPIDKKIIESLPQLKMIAAMSTGYDHIDLKTAEAKGIIVCNVPSYGEITVAEHTLALILALTRKLFPSIKRVKEGAYDFHTSIAR